MALTGAERMARLGERKGGGGARSWCAPGVRRTDVVVHNSGRKPSTRSWTASTPGRTGGTTYRPGWQIVPSLNGSIPILELRDLVEQLEAAELPRGFGRD